jgi:hypothetical protein
MFRKYKKVEKHCLSSTIIIVVGQKQHKSLLLKEKGKGRKQDCFQSPDYYKINIKTLFVIYKKYFVFNLIF